MKFATKLSLLFSGLYLTASVFLISYIYLSEVKTLKDEITHRIEDQAFNTMDKIDQRLFDGLNDIKTLANDQVIRSRNSTPQQIREKLLEFQAIQRLYASVSFFDLNRLRIADTSGKGVGTHSSMRDYWLNLARGETLVLNLHVSHTLKEGIIHFVCIVKDHNGIPFGVVVARMPLEEIQRIAEKTASFHKTEEHLKIDLVDREGVLLYSNYNIKGLFKDKACDWEVANKKITAGEKIGSVTYICPEHNQEEIVIFVREPGYQNFPGNDWTLIEYIPAGEAFASAMALRNRLIAIFMVIAVFSLLGITFFSRRITRPIATLEQAISAFGAEKLEMAVPVASQDEVGSLATGGLSPRASLAHGKWEISSLAQAFDNMVTTIQQQEIKRTQAEKELKLRAQLLDAASDSIFLHDLDGHFIYVNEAAYKDRGYEQDELLRKDVSVLPTPEYAARREEILQDLWAKGEVTFESAHRRKDGSVMPVEIHARTIDLDDRQLILSVARDITGRKQAETARRESEKKYRTLIETTDTGYLILDSQGKVIDANKEYVRLSGHMRLEEILGRSVAEWTAEHDREQNAAAFVKCLQQGDVRCLEIDYVDEEGRITPIEINAAVTITGQSLQIVSLCRDITERKQAEQGLIDAAQKWRTTFDAIGDGVYLLDSEGKILQCNRAMADLVGKPYSEIIGSTCWEVMHGTAGPIDGCPLVRMKQSRQREILTLPMGDRWLHGMVNPVLNEVGEVTGAVHLIADITKIKRTEENLRQTHDYLENLINYANAPIIVWDSEFRITRFNHAFEHLTGHAAQEVIGQELAILFLEGSRKESIGEIVRTSSGEHWQSVEIPILRKDGEVRIALWNSANVYAEDGTTLVATIAQGQDITERKQAEQGLIDAAQKWRTTFDAIGDGVYLLDSEGKILQCNRAMADLVGKPFSEIVGRHCWEVVHGTAGPIGGCPMERLRQSHHREELVLQMREGWFKATVDPILDEAGNLTGAVHLLVDITQLKRTEAKLLNSLGESMQRQTEVRALLAASRIVVTEFSFEVAVRDILTLSKSLIGFTAGYAALRPEAGMVDQVLLGDIGGAPGAGEPALPPWIAGFQGEIYGQGKLIIHNDLGHSEERQLLPGGQAALDNILLAPLQAGGRSLGHLGLANKPGGFSEDDANLAAGFAELATVSLINQQTGAALRQSEEKHRQLVHQIPAVVFKGYADWSMDFVDGKVEALTGYSQEDFNTRKLKWKDLIMPDDLIDTKRKFMKTWKVDKSYEWEYRIRKKDGEIRWIQDLVHVFNDSSGKIDHVSGILFDITDRKEAEARLARTTRALRALSACRQALAQATDEQDFLFAVCRVIVQEGEYPLAWVGFTQPDEVKSVVQVAYAGRVAENPDWMKITWGKDERSQSPAAMAIKTGQTQVARDILHIPAFAQWHEEWRRWGFNAVIALPLAVDGETIGILDIFARHADAFDVEEVRLLEALAGEVTLGTWFLRSDAGRRQADAASRAKSEFLSNMSHELRTPMNAIIGFSEILQDQQFGPLNEKQSRQINHILTSGRHLLSLINDILDLSKVESGKMTLEFTSVGIADLIQNSLVMIKEKALKHQLHLETDLAPDLADLRIVADERKLKQIMFNLLSNAAKFTPDGGEIKVAAKREAGNLVVSVADTGIGIAPKDHKHIFAAFEQVDSSYTRQKEGTGLGLALTRRLVELHRGRIWVESAGKDKGSTFIFIIPLQSGVEPETLPKNND